MRRVTILGLAVAAGLLAVLLVGPGDLVGPSDEPAPTPTTVSHATSDSAVGPLYDPVVAGEQTPPGYRPLLERDTIAPIYEPEFVPAEEVDWSPRTLVLGVAIGAEAKAYPIIELNFREMVIDELAGEPILVSWCPLCGTAMAHSRELRGETLVFGNQGHLWQNAMTWYDHGTGSIWSQPTGEAILGPRAGDRLERIPSTLTSWRSWLEDHPETRALDARGEPSSYRLADMLLVVELGDQVVGFPFELLRDVGVVNTLIDGVEVAVVVDPEDLGSWAVFARSVADQVVTLEMVDGVLVDEETGTAWDPARGIGLEGDLKGEVLALLPGFTIFPRDFESFWPDATTWPSVDLPEVNP